MSFGTDQYGFEPYTVWQQPDKEKHTASKNANFTRLTDQHRNPRHNRMETVLGRSIIYHSYGKIFYHDLDRGNAAIPYGK